MRAVRLNQSGKMSRKPRFYYGWVIVFVILLANLALSAETYPIISVFLKPITEEFGWSRSLFAGSVTIGTLLGGILAVYVGPLIDRYGARWILVGSFALIGAVMLLMSAITSLWQLYAVQVVGRSLAMGVIGLSLGVVVPKWFTARRGTAMALANLGGALGGAILPLYVQFLVGSSGWRGAAVATGLVVWALSIVPIAIFLRRRPEDIGLLPDGLPVTQTTSAAPSVAAGRTLADVQSEVSLTRRQVLRLPSFYLLTGAFALTNLIGTGLIFHLVAYFTDRGLTPQAAVTALAIWSVSGAVGSLAYGYLADRFSIRWVLMASFLLTALGCVTLLPVQSAAPAVIWSIYQGAAQTGTWTLQGLALSKYYGKESLGEIQGIVMLVALTANAVGPLAAAFAYSITAGYILTYLTFGALSLVCSAAVLLAKPPLPRGTAAGVPL